MPPQIMIAATDPRVVIVGRYAVVGTSVRFDWPGTEIRLRVRGSNASARISLRMNGNKNYFSVAGNGGAAPRMLSALSTRSKDYLLPLEPVTSGDGELHITIRKRTEAAAPFGIFSAAGSAVTLRGVVLDADSELLPPLALPRRLLEFYGDSDTCAFGNEGRRTSASSMLSLIRSAYSAPAQDASRAYPALVAAALDASAHNISWSGLGVCWNAPFCGQEAMAQKWDRLVATDAGCGTVHSTAEASSGRSSHQPDAATAEASSGRSSHQPDAVVIYLGGNDYWTMGDHPPSGRSVKGHTEDSLVEGYAALLSAIRAARPPPIPIFVLECEAQSSSCLDSEQEQAAFAETMGRVLHAAVERASDPLTSLMPLRGQPPIDLADDSDFGVMGHWSVKGHAKIAAALAEQLGDKLGWRQHT